MIVYNKLTKYYPRNIYKLFGKRIHIQHVLFFLQFCQPSERKHSVFFTMTFMRLEISICIVLWAFLKRENLIFINSEAFILPVLLVSFVSKTHSIRMSMKSLSSMVSTIKNHQRDWIDIVSTGWRFILVILWRLEDARCGRSKLTYLLESILCGKMFYHAGVQRHGFIVGNIFDVSFFYGEEWLYFITVILLSVVYHF